MFARTKLATRLLLGFSVPLIAMILITSDAGWVNRWIERNIKLVETENNMSFQMAMLAQKMKLDVVEVQQFLSDISATRARDGLDDGLNEAGKSRESFLSGLSKFREMYKQKNDSEKLEKMDELEKAFSTYYESGKTMAKAYVEGGPSAGNKLMPAFDKATDALTEIMDGFVEEQKLEGQSALAAISSYQHLFWHHILAAVALTFLFSAIATWLTIRSITRPLNHIIEVLREGADRVAGASGQVSSASRSLADGSSEQAASIEEISSSLEELSSMTKRNSDNAGQANQLVKQANGVMEQANESMGELIESINEISRTSEDTSKIIKTIDEIAFQTNLLALNAAVEAARAGEAGAGFAVVAEEVRNLAMRAAQAAKNTAGLIEGTVSRVKEGAQRVDTTNGAFSGMAETAANVGTLVGEISEASAEQFVGIDQVNKAVAQMERVTQSSAENAEELAQASGDMNAQVEHIREMLNELAVLIKGSGAKREKGSAELYKAHLIPEILP